MTRWYIGLIVVGLGLPVACVGDSQEAGELPGDDDGAASADGNEPSGDETSSVSAGSEGQDDDNDSSDGEDSSDASSSDTAAGEGSDDSSSTDDGPTDECEPAGLACDDSGTATSSFSLTGLVDDGEELIDIEEDCAVLDFVSTGDMEGPSSATLELDCDSGTLTLEVNWSTGLGTPDFGGPTVNLRYYARLVTEIDIARGLVLRDEFDDITFVGLDVPQLSDISAVDMAPLSLDLAATDCAAASNEFGIPTQDAALAVDLGDAAANVFAGQDVTIAGGTSYRVVGNEVERILCFPEDAGYNYAEWFVTAIVMRVTE